MRTMQFYMVMCLILKPFLVNFIILVVSFDFFTNQRIIIRSLVDLNSEKMTGPLTEKIEIEVAQFSVIRSELNSPQNLFNVTIKLSISQC